MLFCFIGASEFVHSSVVFIGYVLKGQVDVEERCIDRSVSHEFLDDRERYLLTYEVGAEGVTKTVSVSVFKKTRLTAMAEDFTQALGHHALSPARALENDKACGVIDAEAFERHVLLYGGCDPGRDGDETFLAALAPHPDLFGSKINVVDL